MPKDADPFDFLRNFKSFQKIRYYSLWSRFKFAKNYVVKGFDPVTIPQVPGVYVLCARDKKFDYPWGKSKIIYIGKSSDSLRNRLSNHHKYTKQAVENAREYHNLYYPVYEYGARFHAQYGYITADTATDAGELEGKLLARFASLYGAIPVANNQHTDFWHRVEQ